MRLHSRLAQLAVGAALLQVACIALSQTDANALRAEREALRSQIQAVEQRIREQETGRQRASDGLREIESRISRGQRQLETLEANLTELRQQLAQQETELALAEAEFKALQDQIAELARQGYAHGSFSPWQLLLSGERPEQLLRELGYLGYVAQERAALVRRASEQQQAITDLQRQTLERTASIERARTEAQQQRQALDAERSQRRAQLAQLDQALAAERRQAQTLREDEARMDRLLAEIAAARERVRREEAAAEARRRQEAQALEQQMQAQARQQAAAPAQPRQATQATQTVQAPQTRAPEAVATSRPSATPSAPRAGLDTSINPRAALPIRGEITQRFGVARRGASGTTKGVFYRASAGEPVRAVADGTIVFSEWLRGFGNLIIVDHGGDILTVYGNNESLLREVGDQVQRGEVIAAAGNTGGQPETGLYFEVRQRGQPIDPRRWLQQHR